MVATTSMRARAEQRSQSEGVEEDSRLVERVRAGDLAAYEQLVARHRPWLLRRCTGLLGNDAHLAEDVVQNTMVKLLNAARQDDRPLQVAAWLSVVSRNACFDERRRRKADLPGILPEQAVDPEEPVLLDVTLASAWSALPGRHREVLYLRELVGLPYAQIADILGLSLPAVETLLFRARKALRREYARAGGEGVSFGALGVALRQIDLAALAGSDSMTDALPTTAITTAAVGSSTSAGPIDSLHAAVDGNRQSMTALIEKARLAPRRAAGHLPSLVENTLQAAEVLRRGLLTTAAGVVLSVAPTVPAILTPVSANVASVAAAATDTIVPVVDSPVVTNVGGLIPDLLAAPGRGAEVLPARAGTRPTTATTIIGEHLRIRFGGSAARTIAQWQESATEWHEAAFDIKDRFREQRSAAWSDFVARWTDDQRSSVEPSGPTKPSSEESSSPAGATTASAAGFPSTPTQAATALTPRIPGSPGGQVGTAAASAGGGISNVLEALNTSWDSNPVLSSIGSSFDATGQHNPTGLIEPTERTELIDPPEASEPTGASGTVLEETLRALLN